MIHTEDGSEGGTESEFTNNASQVSSTYGVGNDGREDQFVALQDSAWANGIRERGNLWDARGLPDVNPNYLTVSIETEDFGSGLTVVSTEEYDGVAACAEQALGLYGSTIKYLLSHRDISPLSRPNCCGARWWGQPGAQDGPFYHLARELKLATLS